MESVDLCRKCCYPVKDYNSNMIRDRYGEWVRCSRCIELTRNIQLQRMEWNRRVVDIVRKLDTDLQDYYESDLAHGTLRDYLTRMRECGRSPTVAIRSWRHKVIYLDSAYARSVAKGARQRSSSSQFQIKLDMVPRHQYRRPTDMPLLIAPPMDVIIRPSLPVIYAKPTQVVPLPNSMQRTYYPANFESRDISDPSSESSDAPQHRHFSGIVKGRTGRVAAVVTDSHGNRLKSGSGLAYFAT